MGGLDIRSELFRRIFGAFGTEATREEERQMLQGANARLAVGAPAGVTDPAQLGISPEISPFRRVGQGLASAATIGMIPPPRRAPFEPFLPALQAAAPGAALPAAGGAPSGGMTAFNATPDFTQQRALATDVPSMVRLFGLGDAEFDAALGQFGDPRAVQGPPGTVFGAAERPQAGGPMSPQPGGTLAPTPAPPGPAQRNAPTGSVGPFRGNPLVSDPALSGITPAGAPSGAPPPAIPGAGPQPVNLPPNIPGVSAPAVPTPAAAPAGGLREIGRFAPKPIQPQVMSPGSEFVGFDSKTGEVTVIHRNETLDERFPTAELVTFADPTDIIGNQEAVNLPDRGTLARARIIAEQNAAGRSAVLAKIQIDDTVEGASGLQGTAKRDQARITLENALGSARQAAGLVHTVIDNPGAIGVPAFIQKHFGGLAGSLTLEDLESRIAEATTGLTPEELGSFEAQMHAMVASSVPFIAGEESGRITDRELALTASALGAGRVGSSPKQMVGGMRAIIKLALLRADRQAALLGRHQPDLSTPELRDAHVGTLLMTLSDDPRVRARIAPDVIDAVFDMEANRTDPLRAPLPIPPELRPGG